MGLAQSQRHPPSHHFKWDSFHPAQPMQLGRGWYAGPCSTLLTGVPPLNHAQGNRVQCPRSVRAGCTCWMALNGDPQWQAVPHICIVLYWHGIAPMLPTLPRTELTHRCDRSGTQHAWHTLCHSRRNASTAPACSSRAQPGCLIWLDPLSLLASSMRFALERLSSHPAPGLPSNSG